MLNLTEYRSRSKLLAGHLPLACLVAPSVVLNKDGSFQRSARFRGPDLESATAAKLVATCARINNVLRRFGSGWPLFFEAERHAPRDFPRADARSASRSWAAIAATRATTRSASPAGPAATSS